VSPVRHELGPISISERLRDAELFLTHETEYVYPILDLRTQTDPIYEMLCSFEI
jgi:hypothetical protein